MDVDKLIEELPKADFIEAIQICKWEGYWLTPSLVKSAVDLRSRFDARDDDVFLASTMNSGTTWLKSLSFCIMQRQHNQTLDALTVENPHILVPTVEAISSLNKAVHVDLYDASAPRLLHTHLPHALLPDSVKNSPCKVVYVARNPKDTLVSSWHFLNTFTKVAQEPLPLEKMVEGFCSGTYLYGPFVEHLAGYWEESRKSPNKVLFLKYEELKEDPRREVMKIAEFLGRPFGEDEGGEVDEIVGRCSLERLKNLEVNKSEWLSFYHSNSSFFRKGEVGDFKNHLTPEMEVKIGQTISSKLEALGLIF